MGARLIDKDSKVVKKVKSKSPYDNYELCGYIEGDGSAYLDLGVVAYSTHKYQVEFQPVEGHDNWIWGGRTKYQTNEIGICVSDVKVESRFTFNSSSTNSIDYTLGASSIWTATMENGKNRLYRSNVLVNEGTTTVTDFVSPYTQKVFGRHNGTEAVFTDMAWGKVYSIKEWDENRVLIHNYCPCKQISTGKYGLLDVVTFTFFGNSNTSGAITGGSSMYCKKQYENINGVFEPTYYNGYVLYNELKSDGNAYIDLGHKGDSTHRYEIDFEYKLESADTSTYKNFFGARSGYRQNEISIPKGTTSTSVAVMQNGASNGVRKTFTLLSTNSRYKISISRSEIKVNVNGTVSTQANTVTTDFTTPYNMLAFAVNENGSQNITNATFHSIKEYDANGKLLYHYVPARRQSDNALGMLDVINGVFYGNANSTGYFLVGDSFRITTTSSHTINSSALGWSVYGKTVGDTISAGTYTFFNDSGTPTNYKNLLKGFSSMTLFDGNLMNFSKIMEITEMLSGCTSLTTVDLRKVIFPKLIVAQSMFYGCSGLNAIRLDSMNFSTVTNVIGMFQSCTNSSLNIYLCSGALNLSPTAKYTNIFYGVSTSAKLKVPTGTLASFQAHTIWSTFPGTIEEY